MFLPRRGLGQQPFKFGDQTGFVFSGIRLVEKFPPRLIMKPLPGFFFVTQIDGAVQRARRPAAAPALISLPNTQRLTAAPARSLCAVPDRPTAHKRVFHVSFW